MFVQNRVFCLLHLHSTPPLGGFPSEYRHPVWYGKTRIVWLPDSEKLLMIGLCLFVLTQLTSVTDIQAHTQTPRDTSTSGKNCLCLCPSVFRCDVQQWVQTTRYRRSVMMISNGCRMLSSTEPRGRTESTARDEQPMGGNSNR